MSTPTPHNNDTPPAAPKHHEGVASDATLRRLGTALQGLRFGSVLAVVQDGIVVQIERTEKTRFNR